MRKEKTYFDIDNTTDRLADHLGCYDVFGFAVSDLDVSVRFRQKDRIIRRVDGAIWRAQEPAREFSLLHGRERGIVPYSCDLIVLDPRIDNSHTELLEADTAAAVLRELAIHHGVYRVRRVDV